MRPRHFHAEGPDWVRRGEFETEVPVEPSGGSMAFRGPEHHTGEAVARAW